MARIALAVGGAIAGALLAPFTGGLINPYLGAEIGFTIGGVLGGILFPGKLPPGPRLNDLIVSTATNGAPIPFGYGQVRVAGNIIWAPPIVEKSVTKSVKGGPKQTTYSYTGNFAVAFGEGPGTVGRIWFDSKIIYDPVSVGASAPITGVSWNLVTELATFQCTLNPAVGSTVAVAGVGSGYDGDWPCQQSGPTSFQLFIPGSGLPSLGAGGTATSNANNVITGASEIATSAHFNSTLNPPLNSQVTISGVGSGYDGTFQCIASTPTAFVVFNPTTGLPTLGAGGTASFPAPAYPPPVIYTGTETQGPDPSIQAFEGAANTPAYRGLIYCVFTNFPLNDFGNRVPNVRAEITYRGGALTQIAGFGPADVLTSNVGNGSSSSLGALTPGSNNEMALWVEAGTGTVPPNFNQVVGGDGIGLQLRTDTSSFNPIGPTNGGKWAGVMQLFRFGGPQSLSVTNVAVKTNVLTFILNQNVPLVVGTSVLFGTLTNATFLNGTIVGILSSVLLPNGAGVQCTASTNHTDYASTPDSGGATWQPWYQVSGMASGAWSAPQTTPMINNVNKGSLIIFFTFSLNNDSNTLGNVSDSQGNAYTVQRADQSGAHAGYAYAITNAAGPLTITATYTGLVTTASRVAVEFVGGGSNGTLAPGNSLSLASMVLDICQRAGLSANQIDVSQLIGITPPGGYVVTRPSTGQACIAPLASAYFFDGVETNGKMTFVPRGGSSLSLAVPEADLGLLKDNYKVVESIGQAQDLPREIQVLYNDKALDYQQNKTQKRRHTRIVKTKNQTLYELPLTIDSTTARQIAEKALFLAYLERKPYDFNLWRATYMLYDPTDVINFTYEGQSFTMRITKSTIGADFQIALTGVNENAANYTSIVNGTSGTGVTPGSGKTLPDSQLFMFDIPLLRDIDANTSGSGYYFALGSLDVKHWPGGILEKSSDNTSFSQEDLSNTAVSYGYATTTLAAPTHSPWAWDEDNTVTVFMVNGTLASDTLLNVLNGNNAGILGGEVIQWANAALNTDGSYTLSMLLRGRRGTEAACNNHGPSELFVFLNNPGVVRHQVTSADLQVLRYYEGVTYGQTVDPTKSKMFTNTGNDLRPYAVAGVQGSFDGSNNLTVTWVRRTRIGGDWLEGIGTVPLSELTESYDVDILNGSGQVVRTFAALSSPTVTYSAMQQVADFGSMLAAVTMNIYQNSAAIGRGFVNRTTVGLGLLNTTDPN